ncbi:MAG: peptide-methionine (S)-S-oxide reductase [Sphingobacteriales bacterium]|nr:MAG: peptide-methionine (S)-S-oxide reductase [Sphingobacteriales bacterium]TAF81342.1 MAG: peptide-methionine (S)-S-oxide reductase [Sphingobacteriales bacterium]
MKQIISNFYLRFLILLCLACNGNGQTKAQKDVRLSLTPPNGQAVAAFAEGCFWCSEHIFESVEGVNEVISGYAGGTTINPTYDIVNTETTGHAETVLVYYNPKIISYKELVNVFFASHDPTTPNQQGPDRGSSYRSILFYQNPAEKETAMQSIKEISASNRFDKPLVTELQQLNAFYIAEDYHQDYIKHDTGNPYVKNVSIPRFQKFKKSYKGKLKQ